MLWFCPLLFRSFPDWDAENAGLDNAGPTKRGKLKHDLSEVTVLSVNQKRRRNLSTGSKNSKAEVTRD